MQLIPISKDDLALFESINCDPLMMTGLGGPTPRERVPQILQNAVESVEDGTCWYYKIILDDSNEAAGAVCIWENTHHGENINEMGWTILPPFQGKGLGSKAVRAVLDKARSEKRWDVVHAFPGITNIPSNGICKKTGFTKLEECDIEFRGNILHCNHWQIDLRSVSTA
jgi:RimJ/RimL family protein N-acetyltransferase